MFFAGYCIMYADPMRTCKVQKSVFGAVESTEEWVFYADSAGLCMSHWHPEAERIRREAAVKITAKYDFCEQREPQTVFTISSICCVPLHEAYVIPAVKTVAEYLSEIGAVRCAVCPPALAVLLQENCGFIADSGSPDTLLAYSPPLALRQKDRSCFCFADQLRKDGMIPPYIPPEND